MSVSNILNLAPKDVPWANITANNIACNILSGVTLNTFNVDASNGTINNLSSDTLNTVNVDASNGTINNLAIYGTPEGIGSGSYGFKTTDDTLVYATAGTGGEFKHEFINGAGDILFDIYSSGGIRTQNNLLDDGFGNQYIGSIFVNGGLTASQGGIFTNEKPTLKTDPGTLLPADLLCGVIIGQNGAPFTLTMPTGADLSAYILLCYKITPITGLSFSCLFINTLVGTMSLANSTGMTIQPSALGGTIQTISQGEQRVLNFNCIGTNQWMVYL